MIIFHADDVITLTGLRHVLGLPATRPEGVRDLLAVTCDRTAPVPNLAVSPRQLALGDWPEDWRAKPETGPRYLVVLRQLKPGYVIVTIEDIDPDGWGADMFGEPRLRVVPVRRTSPATAHLAGCRLDLDVTFGWPLTEEQYAFL